MITFRDLPSAEFEKAYKNDTNGVVLDVRTPDEVREGAIPGHVHLDVNAPDFYINVVDLDREKNYYVYCRSGGRSAKACLIMRSAGFSGEIFNLHGGITDWEGEISK